MNKLREASIKWSIKHFCREGDNDLLPLPFEFNLIKRNKNKFINELSRMDISSHVWDYSRSFLVPKDDKSFRLIKQLSPVDSILYAAVTKEIGSRIERKRVPANKNVVFSHRFSPSQNGSFFKRDDGWKNFWIHSKKYAKTCKHVMLTDITDFYNQIYHHAVRNVLDECGIKYFYITALEKLFEHLSGKVSRGIPVGPHASHVIAEAVLIDFDNYLLSKNVKYCRFVDDIHVFCSSKEEAQVAIGEIANYLDCHQKLLLNRYKTDIVPSKNFVRQANNVLSVDPINDSEGKLLQIVNAHQDSPYAVIPLKRLKPREVKLFSKNNIEDVLASYVSSEAPNYSRLKWFLRRLAQVGLPGGVDFIIKKFEEFYPALSEVALYLKSSKECYSGVWATAGARLVEVLKNPIVANSEYLRVVILELFEKINGLDHESELLNRYKNLDSSSCRKILMAAAQSDNVGWIRAQKQKLSEMNPWCRRALLYSARILPKDERKHWLRSVKANDLLEEEIIQYSRSV